ncbi:MAG: undecaprenyl-diphosphate phosphatase [Pseudomonadota bacterium]
MDNLYLFWLALIQGVSEFLPVSSSAHLIIFPHLLNRDDQGIVIDVALHFGTLLAVLFYFRKDCIAILLGAFDLVLMLFDKKKHLSNRANLFCNLSIATLPIIITGFFLFDLVALWGRNPAIIIGATLLFCPLLWLADRVEERIEKPELLNWKQAFWIGCCQIFALIPGASRAGMCLIGTRALGLGRKQAMRFTMMLSVPAIIGATGLTLLKWISDAPHLGDINIESIMFAFMFAFISAFLTIFILMRFIERIGLTIFVFYRLGFACFLTIWFYF